MRSYSISIAGIDVNIQLTLNATMDVTPSNKGGQKFLLDDYMHTQKSTRKKHMCAMPFTPLQGKSEDISGSGYTCFWYFSQS